MSQRMILVVYDISDDALRLRTAVGEFRRRIGGALAEALQEFLERNLAGRELKLQAGFRRIPSHLQGLEVTVFKSFSEAAMGILNLCDGRVAHERRKT
ncbi:hypothetical protein [Thermofilum pendens]